MRYFLDTNFLLRYILNDIPSQADLAEKYFKQAKSNKILIYIPLLVFVEMDFALSRFYKFSKSKLIEVMENISNMPYIEIEKREIILEALDEYKRNNLDFVDLIFYCEAQFSGRKLLTFDKKLSSFRPKKKKSSQ